MWLSFLWLVQIAFQMRLELILSTTKPFTSPDGDSGNRGLCRDYFRSILLLQVY
jgi:hypothetical protein